MTRLPPHSKKIAVLGKKFKSCYLVDVLSVFNFAVAYSTHPVYMCHLSFFKEIWLLKNKFKSHYQPIRGIISIILETRRAYNCITKVSSFFCFPSLFFSYIYIYICSSLLPREGKREIQNQKWCNTDLKNIK